MMNKIKMMMAFAAVAVLAAQAEDPWRFINIADWHWAEGYVWQEKSPDQYATSLAKHTAEVATIKKLFGGELMTLPGDSNGGHWDTPKFIKDFMPGATPEEAILKAGKFCYSGMSRAFKAGGYPILLMAVGDHELGDNPWPAGSDVSRCQPQFREAFSSVWNTNPDGGKFLFDKPIGRMASRPLGTPYEGTSYAFRYKNVLFVTVDVFHQEDPDKVIGDEGSVKGAVEGKHLEWLDGVLGEARKDSSIKHIIVQAHLPVIYPVRKVSSSGMLMDKGMDCGFWKTLRKHKVDIYFAGEVHDNTVTKDAESDLLQVVTRGNFFNNVMAVDVKDDRLEFTTYNHPGGDDVTDGKYEQYGHLVVDKSGAKTTIQGEGCLEPLDRNARMFHFTFEQEFALKDRPIVGLSGRDKKKSDTNIRGLECDELFVNQGAFGQQYSALETGVELVDGVHGKAALLNADSRMAVWAMGPVLGGYPVSYALWVKTTSTENQILVNSCSIWANQLKNFFNLDLNDGVPEVMVAWNRTLVADSAKLNDGKWHHIAAVVPKEDSMLSEVRIHVDGKPVSGHLSGEDEQIHIGQAIRFSFGGMGYSRKEFDKLPVKPFVGAMDDVSLWTRSLTDEEVAADAK